MKRHDEKRAKRKRLFMSMFIVAIMTLSVLGYMIGRDTKEQLKYNDHKFYRYENRYGLKINNYDVLFYFFPSQVEDLNISKEALDKIKTSVQIDVTSDVDSKYKEAIALAQFELAQSLPLNEQFVRSGFTTANEFDRPIINCEAATETVPVLLFKESNQTIVYKEDKCIIVEAKSEQDFLAVKDRILYSVFGIIP